MREVEALEMEEERLLASRVFALQCHCFYYSSASVFGRHLSVAPHIEQPVSCLAELVALARLAQKQQKLELSQKIRGNYN